MILKSEMNGLCQCCSARQEKVLISKTLRLTKKEKSQREEQNEQRGSRSERAVAGRKFTLNREVIYKAGGKAIESHSYLQASTSSTAGKHSGFPSSLFPLF